VEIAKDGTGLGLAKCRRHCRGVCGRAQVCASLCGDLHRVDLAVERLLRARRPLTTAMSSSQPWLRALAVFLLVAVTWVSYRSPSAAVAVTILESLLLIQSEGLIRLYAPMLTAVSGVVLCGPMLRTITHRPPTLAKSMDYLFPLCLVEALLIDFFVASERLASNWSTVLWHSSSESMHSNLRPR
jgi:hypothetical protein